MKPIEILADYFASQKLSEIHSQIDAVIRLAVLSDTKEREKLIEFRDELHDLVDAAYLIAGK
jgi:hypothetical protein